MSEKHVRLSAKSLQDLNEGKKLPVEIKPGEYLTLHPPEEQE